MTKEYTKHQEAGKKRKARAIALLGKHKQSEIARMIGTTRQYVSKLARALKNASK